MRKPLNGVRVLEVAQFTFVPSAGAVLADWGAEVVKIEHPVTGDAQRGLVKVLGAAATVPDRRSHRSWRRPTAENAVSGWHSTIPRHVPYSTN